MFRKVVLCSAFIFGWNTFSKLEGLSKPSLWVICLLHFVEKFEKLIIYSTILMLDQIGTVQSRFSDTLVYAKTVTKSHNVAKSNDFFVIN